MYNTFEELLDFLFTRTTLKPQLGFAGGDKKAWLWLPGEAKIKRSTNKIIKTAPLKGCTQCAYEDWFTKSSGQDCEVCWFGLDIDQEDNEINLIPWALAFVLKHKVSMVRTSCSGQGIHMIWKLNKPVNCTHEQSKKIVKRLADKKKELVEAEGIHVCQANKRMFWLTGAKNKTVYKSTHEEVFNILVMPKPITQSPIQFEVSEGIQKFVNLFQSKGVINSPTRSNKVYVGDAVKALRENGETVYTKSSCSGNGHVNGYIDIQKHQISLWSYADGHTIWNYTALEGLI